RRGVHGRAHPPVRGGAPGPRGAAHDVPPREGPGVRCGVPPATSRRGAPLPCPPFGRRTGGGTSAPLRRHHAFARASVPVVAPEREREAESVPGRARGRRGLAAAPWIRSDRDQGSCPRPAVRPVEGLSEAA